MVCYVEGLNHNLFSVGQLCDADLEVEFRKSTRFVKDLQGKDLLMGNHGSNLYTIALQESSSLTLICFISNALPTQAWLWQRRLSHLNFDTINLLSKNDIVNGLLKLNSGLGIQDHNNELSSSRLVPNDVPTTNKTHTSKQELELLFSPMYEEYFNARNQSVSKSSDVSDNIVMDPNSSLGKICLGEDVVVISSDKVEGSGDWNSLEFQDTANSGQKKEMKAMAYDGEINLGVEENMISNKYAVKLCLEHEVKKGNKVVKKELIVALRGKIYFVKFIINPEEDDVELGVIFGRSFLCMTKAITDFKVGTITIYPDIDLFLEETKEEEKSNDDWDHLLDFNIDDVPLLGEERLSPFICKMGKSSRNKKRAMENLNFFYQDIGTSSSAGDKVELDGKIIKEEEEAVKRIKGEALKEKDDLGAFIFPIRLEGQVNKNALADTGSDINTMPFRIYVQLGREDMKKVDRGITMINQTQAEAMGILTNVLCQVGVTTLIAKFLILYILIDCDLPIVVGRGFLRTISGIVNTPKRLFSTFDGFCHQTFCAARSDVIRNAESDSDDKEDYQIKRNKFGAPIYGPNPTSYLNYNDPADRSLAIETVTNPFWKINIWKKAVGLLGSLPVPLKNVNWKPDYKGSYTKEEEATGQWRTAIRLTDPYGNIYLHGLTMKKTNRKLSKYHKLSDIMSPNWFME
ncbi:reverse transcriptase domain-containing protein [Tanacetum coccineum]|uniref:Reverse transcriptase domain-containing protein n=1 Tax=Tanacetum coccineum TaxID=301880 RepID=A0ABQ5FCP3_9ASTR